MPAPTPQNIGTIWRQFWVVIIGGKQIILVSSSKKQSAAKHAIGLESPKGTALEKQFGKPENKPKRKYDNGRLEKQLNG